MSGIWLHCHKLLRHCNSKPTVKFPSNIRDKLITVCLFMLHVIHDRLTIHLESSIQASFWVSHKILISTWNRELILFVLQIHRAVFMWKLIDFALTTQHDWLKKLAPLFQPIRSNPIVTRSHSFSRALRQLNAIFFEFWLVHWIVRVLCDWLDW